ncbi:MAG: heavy metal translocating P-type ATPase [Isosphaeraceae bacterium]
MSTSAAFKAGAKHSTASSAPAVAPRVVWSDDSVTVCDPRLFGPGERSASLARTFLARVLALEEVRSVRLDRANGSAVVLFHGPGGTGRFGPRLSSALRGEVAPLETSGVPSPPAAGSFTLYQHGKIATTVEVRVDRPGLLRLRVPGVAVDSGTARRVESDLSRVPGVESARFSRWAGGLLVRYDPAAVGPVGLIRRVEAASALPLPAAPEKAADGAEAPVRFGVANANLGLAVAADMAFPVLAPASALMSIGLNLGNLRQSAVQVRRGEIGVPVLYSTILVTTLASGQFMASAAMAWMFRYWSQRTRTDLARERLRIVEESRPPAPGACRLNSGGHEQTHPTARLRPGDVVAVGADEVVPADGLVVQGSGTVDERGLAWGDGVATRNPGDRLQAGSSVLFGRFVLAVERPWAESRASAVGRALEAASRPGPVDELANRAVGPTIATAGLGLLVGGLTTTAAVLRPDLATGPDAASRLGRLRSVSAALRRGLLVRDAQAFDHARATNLIVLDDGPHLRRQGVELAMIQTALPETDPLLQYAAAAARHLADDRSLALAEACRQQSLPQLRLDADADSATDLDPFAAARPAGMPGPLRLTLRHGRRKVRLLEMPPDGSPAPPLALEVDGVPAAIFRFRRARGLEAAATVARLKRLTRAPVVLLSNYADRDARSLARWLGVDAVAAGLDLAGKERYLAEAGAKGLNVAWIGDGRVCPSLARSARLALSVAGETDATVDPSAVQLWTTRLGAAADLWSIARSHAAEISEARRLTLLPNLACVAGAFTFGFTSLTAVVVSNLGTMFVYNRSTRSLHSPGRPAGRVVKAASTPTDTGANRAARTA